MHGGVSKENLKDENVDAITAGCKNLERYINNISKFGVPVAVAINEFYTDTKNEHQAIIDFCKNLGVACKISSHWSDGGKGAADLAQHVAELADSNQFFKTLYDDELSYGKKQNISQLASMVPKILLQIKK